MEIKVDKKGKGQQEKEKEEFGEDVSMEGDMDEGDSDGEKEDDSKEEDAEEKQKKEENVIHRLIPPSSHLDLTNTHNVSLMPNQHGAAQFTANKDSLGKTKKKKVKLICSSLILMSNKIPDLTGFYNIVDQVMVSCDNLRWIDLSHNTFSKLTTDFGRFAQLRSLYLHCNKIRDMEELRKIQNISKLRTLTIHGNPLDQLPNFRTYVIAVLPNIKKLDTVLVSYKERDNAMVWTNTFNMGKRGLPCAPIEEKDLIKQKGDDDEDNMAV